jgi:hypothetical protein
MLSTDAAAGADRMPAHQALRIVATILGILEVTALNPAFATPPATIRAKKPRIASPAQR